MYYLNPTKKPPQWRFFEARGHSIQKLEPPKLHTWVFESSKAILGLNYDINSPIGDTGG